MTDLDTLRRALRAEQPPTWSAGQSPDLDRIMTQGRRLRWRRRIAVGGAVLVCAVGAVSGVLAGTSHPGRATPVPAQRPVSRTHAVREKPTYLPPSQAPTPSPESSADPLPTPSR